MKELNFKNWLVKSEEATTTACVANFARPIMPLVRREFPNNKKKKK